ncbi:hypothetical protein EHQ97_10720 [Leptospira adleri]|nr:hypothetical protein EHQ97_10720 [Leptospira adleri]
MFLRKNSGNFDCKTAVRGNSILKADPFQIFENLNPKQDKKCLLNHSIQRFFPSALLFFFF